MRAPLSPFETFAFQANASTAVFETARDFSGYKHTVARVKRREKEEVKSTHLIRLTAPVLLEHFVIVLEGNWLARLLVVLLAVGG